MSNLSAWMSENNGIVLEWIKEEVNRFVYRYGCPVSLDKDDLISEGWLIAHNAIKAYDKERKASIKTFIKTCVKNKLSNRVIFEKRRVNEDICDYEDYMILQNNFEYIDLCLDIEKQFACDEIRALELMCSGTKTQARREVGLQCLAHTLQKLRLNAQTLT